MVDKKRDIFIKLQNIEKILEILTNIKSENFPLCLGNKKCHFFVQNAKTDISGG